MTRYILAAILVAIVGLAALTPGDAQAQTPVWEEGGKYDFDYDKALRLNEESANYYNWSSEDQTTLKRFYDNQGTLLINNIIVDYRSDGSAYLGNDYQLWGRYDLSGGETNFVRTVPFLLNAKKHKAATLAGNPRRQQKASDAAGISLGKYADAHPGVWDHISGYEEGFYGHTARAARKYNGRSEQVFQGYNYWGG